MGHLFRTQSTLLVPLEGDYIEPAEDFREAHRGFRQIILGTHPSFPCYFAAIAEKQGSLVYSYLSGSQCYDREALYSVLDEFVLTAGRLRPFPVLALFVQSDKLNKTLAEDESLFWQLIDAIDDSRSDVGSAEADPSASEWVLKYKNTAIFVTGHSPAYKARLSRYSSHCLTLVIQEKLNLARIAKNTNEVAEIMTHIRSLVDKYDPIPRSPLLGLHGTAGVFDWHQFWLPDSNEPIDMVCKIKTKKV